ncbi:hypothetical protein LINPERPRIM_LOCUS26684, partial [Linum perenne]
MNSQHNKKCTMSQNTDATLAWTIFRRVNIKGEKYIVAKNENKTITHSPNSPYICKYDRRPS